MRLKNLIILFLGMGIGGCATVDRSAGLEVSLANLEIQEATLLETTALITIRLQNENPEPVRIQGAVHKIDLNGVYLGKGMTSEGLEIPAFGTGTQKVVVYLSNLRMTGPLRSILANQQVAYELKSTLRVHGAINRHRLQLLHSGALNLRAFEAGTPVRP